MCNNTSLSSFLDGVSFVDESCGMELEVMDFESEFLAGVDAMLDTSMSMAMDTMDNSELAVKTDPLPPLSLAVNMEHEDLDALLSPPSDATSSSTNHFGTTITANSTANTYNQYPGSLENLAHCMRTSEMALAQMQKNLQVSQSQSHNLAVFSKANHFFTGSRATITPELELSRQKVWSLIHQHHHQQQQHHVYTHKAPATAAA
ncbi:expressed unknown protein [Seminavis robusta]|uniref:Uncharacterized protein n=1 Tax=Seminavis robusta TaxID=568900 RepID=A0A9N8D8R0_9STRA|nr:expressed unknown protein [Seminavis robusta]|eukprot:Sro3_g002210.1 n/a (204) ;mRNA; r:86423-87034